MRRSFCGADGLRVDGAGADNPMFARATSLRSHHAVRNNIDPSRWTHRKTSAPSSSGRYVRPVERGGTAGRGFLGDVVGGLAPLVYYHSFWGVFAPL